MELIGKHLEKLPLKVLQTQESRELRTGDEQFELAIDGVPIRKNQGALKEVLRMVMVKVGLRANNWPNEIEKQVLLDHILQKYGAHTPSEILLAFDLALADKLDLDPKKGETVNCFENFSCLYFSTIMNAYRSWAKDQHRQIKPIMIEDKVSDTTNQDWWNETKSQVKNKKLTVEFVPLELYEWGVKEQLIAPTVDEKWDYFLQAINIRQAALYANLMMDGNDKNNIHIWNEFMRMKQAECFEGDELSRLRNLAKKLVLFDFFKTN